MASASTQSANEPAKEVILVHRVQLKTIIKAQISRRILSSGVSDVVIPSVCEEKKLMFMIIIIMNK